MLKIISIENRGHPDLERIILEVVADCDTDGFMIARTKSLLDELGSVSASFTHTFWMPDNMVKKGDRVLVWTKRGAATKTADEAGPVHNYYQRSGKGLEIREFLT
jgi:hypothetical protein